MLNNQNPRIRRFRNKLNADYIGFVSLLRAVECKGKLREVKRKYYCAAQCFGKNCFQDRSLEGRPDGPAWRGDRIRSDFRLIEDEICKARKMYKITVI